ncbi:hypothetical protein Tco_1003507 [Tanacetum coccineum]|uniref:Phospholipase-like protein n=1 Tax=Tanacetum coccineum TaxID=301880 RepID=A0ABQ5FAD7_9ASTR
MLLDNNLKGEHLLELVKNDVEFNQLDDEDVVRVCLLLALDYVFMGQELRHVITNAIVNLVDDCYKWDAFSWGEYMWSFFHKKVYNVAVDRRKYHLEKLASNPKYEAGRYGHDFEVNTASTSITTASINITTAEPVTTASAPVTTAGVSVSTAEPSTPPTTTILIEDEDLTIAQTLMKMRSVKSKEKSKEKGVSSETTIRPTRGVIMKEASETVTRPIVPPQQQLDPKDKGKEEERVARQREEDDNLISWDNTQAMMKADYELAQRLQAKEQGELTVEEKSKLFVELMDKRKKHFANLRVEEIRRKPPTKAKKRNQMCTYLKNMANYKHSQLKKKSFEEIQTLFDNTMKWVDSFVPMDSEVMEGKDDAEKAELKACLEIVPGDDVTIESLATKYPIVDWKTHILAEDKMYYHIIRADGSAKIYKIFSAVLDDFDRKDMLDLYKLVKERF